VSGGPIRELLEADHARLDALLARSLRADGTLDAEVFAALRSGLARHIGMEEKILFPAAKRAGGAAALDALGRLRADHRQIVAMLVPSPTPALVRDLVALLGPHNELEEGPRGVYAACEEALGPELVAVREALTRAPEVPMRSHYDGPLLALRKK
jgi:hypothetical protein